jgi:cysteine synthase
VTPDPLATDVVDPAVLERAVRRCADQGIELPTFAQLADPGTIPEARAEGVDPDAADPANLFRVHWHNAADRAGHVEVPEHVEMPPELTGVDARIVLALGNRFPMIRAHKVLAAYACLVTRLVTGQFDPTTQRAVWPSTGNYARGGIAISCLLGCRGVAVLPEGMSRERFEWLDRWTAGGAGEVLRTPGTESNVKEIYDACHVLAADPANVVVNQFAEYANHVAHRVVTGPALERVVEAVMQHRPGRLAAFVAASGSAGTLGAGDHLKATQGAQIVAVEALECPTMLCNGYGEHNIQGIGDKHIPLIHNVMNTDVVVAVSDRSTDALDLLFNSPAGHDELRRRGVPEGVMGHLADLGLSSICNLVAAIKTARLLGLGGDDVVVTVATDGSEMYGSERRAYLAAHHPDGFGAADAAAVAARHLDAVSIDHTDVLGPAGRERVFNLGYYTWVEQQGVSLADFDRRRDPSFWADLAVLVEPWDGLIAEFNARTAAAGR